MKVQVLYFDGCPNHGPTVQLVREVIADLNVHAELEEVEVKATSDARELRFLGSPTVHVDGRDIDPEANPGDFSHGCRMYGSSGIPPRDMVVSAIKAT